MNAANPSTAGDERSPPVRPARRRRPAPRSRSPPKRRNVPVLTRHTPLLRRARVPTTSQSLAAGDHHFEVRATDAGGQRDDAGHAGVDHRSRRQPPSGYCAAPSSDRRMDRRREDDPRHTDHAVLRDRRRAGGRGGASSRTASTAVQRWTLTKAIRLKAAHPFGAVFVGGPTPRFADEAPGLGRRTFTAVAIRASKWRRGARVPLLRHRDQRGRRRRHARAVQWRRQHVQRQQSGSGTPGRVVQRDPRYPYLAQGAPATVTSRPGVADAQSKARRRGLRIAAAARGAQLLPRPVQRDALVQGGRLGPVRRLQHVRGLSAHHGVFRQNSLLHEAAGRQRARGAGASRVQRLPRGLRRAQRGRTSHLRSANSASRHVNGDTTLRGNVVEQSQQGVLLECRAGSQAGCWSTGTTPASPGNTIAGRVRDLSAPSAR